MNEQDLTENYIDDNYISLEQAAKYLRVSKIHFRKLLAQGYIPFLNRGVGKKRKDILIKKQSIVDFLESGGVQNGN